MPLLDQPLHGTRVKEKLNLALEELFDIMAQENQVRDDPSLCSSLYTDLHLLCTFAPVTDHGNNRCSVESNETCHPSTPCHSVGPPSLNAHYGDLPIHWTRAIGNFCHHY